MCLVVNCSVLGFQSRTGLIGRLKRRMFIVSPLLQIILVVVASVAVAAVAVAVVAINLFSIKK
jgi:hypothetical protein